uniref:Uncharacterized protein n=1 Tax=Chroomonas mesostigmatica CCMP1168 TaxID=1195612 RepID=A0A248SPL2_9CRYP|nr:hypothetical protein CMESOPL_039 [Chroomonas mesostigmatica CCMP1168]
MPTHLLKISSLLTVFYFTISTTIERNKYAIDTGKHQIQTVPQKSSAFKSEPSNKRNIRKKNLLDLKYHLVKKNSNKENVLQLILNHEGKIIGYKPCSIFHPNYFTKSQPKSIIKTSEIWSKNTTNLCLIKIKFNSAKINQYKKMSKF